MMKNYHHNIIDDPHQGVNAHSIGRKMESFIGRLTVQPLKVLVICAANLVFFGNIALLHWDPRDPVTGQRLISNQLPHPDDLPVKSEHSVGLGGVLHGGPTTGGGRQRTNKSVNNVAISDRRGDGRGPGMQYVVDQGNTKDPVWRSSKEENLFLEKQLKILTKTTIHSPRTCVGDGSTIILTNDVIPSSQPSRHPRPQYILPVMLGNQGPNNQLQAFHFVVAVAMKRNYTVVLAPFFNHPTVDALEMRCFGDTLSPEAFRSLVPSAGMEEFREQCSGIVDAVLIGTRSQGTGQTEEQRLGLELYLDGQTQIFAELNNLTIPSITFNRNDPETIVDLPSETPSTPIKLTEYLDWYPKAFGTERKCVAFVYPYGLLGRFPHHDVITSMSRHLIRPNQIMELVDEFLEKVGTNGSDVICVHWRFNTEWRAFWCASHGRAICEMLDTLPQRVAAQRLAKLMGPQDGVMYFASPLGEKDSMIAELRDTVSSFYSSVDIREKLGASTDGDRTTDSSFVEDEYHLSLMEQEICLRSRLFVSSELSSWSANVVTERRARGLASIHIMDVLNIG